MRPWIDGRREVLNQHTWRRPPTAMRHRALKLGAVFGHSDPPEHTKFKLFGWFRNVDGELFQGTRFEHLREDMGDEEDEDEQK